MISSLHYISQENELSHEENIKAACDAGVKWVQLRVKSKSLDEIEEIAYRSQEICQTYKATFIVNDHVKVAKKVGAGGVHLGKKDMSPVDAKKYLPEKMIIGGTANTFEDIQRLATTGVDYIGLGPFRFTNTKEKLSPILGLGGYAQIMTLCNEHNINIPVIAIGGIQTSDIQSILNSGVKGVAVASLINNATNKIEQVNLLKRELITDYV